jgi:hypothetical protein
VHTHFVLLYNTKTKKSAFRSVVRQSTMSPLSQKYRTAHTFFKRVTTLVTLYGVGMVLAGEKVATPLFDVLGFGPNIKGLNRVGVDYALFAFGVLGSVIVGWMSLIGSIVDLAAYEDDEIVRATTRRSLMLSTSIWFVFDTGFSLVIGEVQHALFNIPFAAVLGAPLYVMEKNDMLNKSRIS